MSEMKKNCPNCGRKQNKKTARMIIFSAAALICVLAVVCYAVVRVISGSMNSSTSSVSGNQESEPALYDAHGVPNLQIDPVVNNLLGLPEAKDYGYDVNVETGALTISGNGAMPSYTSDPDAWGGITPWDEYGDHFTQVKVEEGITVITMQAFRFAGAEEISLPHSLQEIDDKAFAANRSLKIIFYNGTKDEWKQIRKARTWDRGSGMYWYDTDPYRIVCTDGELEQELSPYCGENARWVYDENKREITVYGSGSIDELFLESNCWTGLPAKSFVVEEGITTLNEFFTDRENDQLERIELPSSLQKMGNGLIINPADSFTVLYNDTMQAWEALVERSYPSPGVEWGDFQFFYGVTPHHVKVICTDGTLNQIYPNR